MAEQIPITPAVLSWARERAGFSSTDCSDKFKRFMEWESGDSAPTYAQLEQLASMFKLPIAIFFFPAPPEVPHITETFRTLPKSEVEKLPSRIRLLLRKAKAMQLNLSELAQNRNPSNKLITRDLPLSSSISITELASTVREFIGVSLEDQKGWKDNQTALKEWRSALYRVGIFVFKEAFKENEFSGFCLFDDTFPVIYVNNSSTATRQMFTYFHELAHLLFHTSGVDTLHDDYISILNGENRRIELFCNKFASEFLLPQKVFAELSSKYNASEATAELLAAEFHVSREVIFRRFLDQGRITEQTYNAATTKWNEQRVLGAGKGGDHYWTKLTYLGRDYVSLALSQFHQNRINEIQLADYLDTKPKNVGVLEEYFSKGGSDVRL